MLRTRFSRHVSSIRTSEELDLDRFAGWISDATSRSPGVDWTIAPTSEFVNLWMLRERDGIESLGARVPLVEAPLYDSLTNKWSASQLFGSRGIRVPALRTGFLSEALPLVAKPHRNLGAAGRMLYPWIIRSRHQLDVFLESENPDDYFPQELVRGDSFYLLLHLARNGRVTASSQRNIAQQAGGRSIVLAETSDFHCQPVADRAITVLRDAGFRGLAMIEFLVDRSDACFIEINPRAWGPLQLCLDHASGIVESFLGDELFDDETKFLETADRRPKRAAYSWMGGWFDEWRARRPVHWCGGFRPPLSLRLRLLSGDVYLRRDTWRLTLSSEQSRAR